MIQKLREIAAKAGKSDDDIFTILRCFNEILDVLEQAELFKGEYGHRKLDEALENLNASKNTKRRL